jgi:hypothetical protein
MSEYNSKNYTEQGGEKTVIGGTLEFKQGAVVTGLDGVTVLAAAGAELGGVKAAAKGVGDTVVAKIGPDAKLYVPTYPVLAAAGTALGGIKADAAGEDDTVEVKIGAGDKLFVPASSGFSIMALQSDSVAVDVAGVVADLNTLLSALKIAGLMETTGGSAE